jgi:hypothetical protein
MRIPPIRARVLAHAETQLTGKNQATQGVQKQLNGQKDVAQTMLKDSFERSKDMIAEL